MYLYMKGGSMMIEELYKSYHKDVYFYIYSLCKNQSLSEDLTSETFYQVMISLPSFQGKSDIKTWIFSIARHTAYKEFKKRKREVILDVFPDIAYQEDYPHVIEEMLAYLKTQPEVYQKIFQMRLDGYAYEDIASQVQMNPNSIRVVYHRVKKYLKDQIERSDNYE